MYRDTLPLIFGIVQALWSGTAALNFVLTSTLLTSFYQLRCEHEKAFAHQARLASRGEHCHQEALRLWETENGRASVSNIQAHLLLALSYDTAVVCAWHVTADVC